MASKNPLLERFEREKQLYLEIGEKQGFQKACDYLSIVLNSPEYMGKTVFSGERIEKIINNMVGLSHEFSPAFCPANNKEADVYQERLDKLQHKVYKEKFQPFYERYKWLRRVEYK